MSKKRPTHAKPSKIVVKDRPIKKILITVVEEGKRHIVSHSRITKTFLMVIIPLPISWDVYLVCMECSQGKRVVSMEGCLLGTPEYEWIHSLWGGIT